MGGGHHDTLEDDEHQHLHAEEAQQQQASPGGTMTKKKGKKGEGETPLNTKSRYHRPYQTGCLGCLSRIPGVSLASWLIIFLGAGSYVGGNVVAIKLVADFILTKMCPVMPWVFLGLAGSTVLLATKFLILNHYASGETSRHTLVTSGRNCCTRCCSVHFLVLAYFFLFLWIILFIIQILPLLLLLLTTSMREPTIRGCIDLRYYGYRVKAPGHLAPVNATDGQNVTLVNYVTGSNTTNNSVIAYRIAGTYKTTGHLCGRDLENYTERSFSMIIAVLFALLGAFLIIIGMINFIICLAGNYKHVKEIRHLPYMVQISGGEEYLTDKPDERAAHCRMLQQEGH